MPSSWWSATVTASTSISSPARRSVAVRVLLDVEDVRRAKVLVALVVLRVKAVGLDGSSMAGWPDKWSVPS